LKVRTWLILLALVAVVGLLTAGSIDRYAVGQQGARTSASAGATSEEAKDYARTLSKAFRETSEQVLPSVVAIFNQPAATRTSDRMSPSEEDEDDSEGTPFEDMFRFHPELRRFFRDMPSMPRMPRPGGVGSGVIIDAKGVILTNNHVVAGGGKITVRLQDGREFEAAEVKGDPKTDVAVVRIKGADNLKPAKLGDSDKMAVGDWVLALGDPFGLEGTVTAGIISAKGRAMGIADRESFLQTDAAINPGNSGGPLVNLDGEVIGLNTAITTRSGGNQGVGFAVPINLAKWVADQLLTTGTVKRAYLGVIIQPVTHQLAEQLGVHARQGVLVGDVQQNTPAAKAGVKTGDVIVEFNGRKVTSTNELQFHVEQTKIGSTVPLVVLRDGKRVTLQVTLEEQPANFGLARRGLRGGFGQPETSQFDKLGLEVAALTPEVAERLGVKGGEGVVITQVRPGSAADEAGLSSGMIIVQANRKAVKTVADLEKAVGEPASEKGVLLLVRDAQGSRFVVLKPEK
jgi:serine protease Do